MTTMTICDTRTCFLNVVHIRVVAIRGLSFCLNARDSAMVPNLVGIETCFRRGTG